MQAQIFPKKDTTTPKQYQNSSEKGKIWENAGRNISERNFRCCSSKKQKKTTTKKYSLKQICKESRAKPICSRSNSKTVFPFETLSPNKLQKTHRL
jgi:hypothetical protein